MTQDTPNFILIITDQQRADFLGCAGHPVLKTPNIDRLAERGVRFTRFHVTSPICSPNRAALMTGRMPSVNGVRGHGVPLPQDTVTVADLLRDTGYRTGMIGKSHLVNHTEFPAIQQRPEPPEGHRPPAEDLSEARRSRYQGRAYDQEKKSNWMRSNGEVSRPYYGFDEVDMTVFHGDDIAGHYLAWTRAKGLEIEKLIGPENALPHDSICPQGWRTAVPEDANSTAYIADRSKAFLDRRDADGAPFFLYVSFPDPHHPFTPAGKYWDMYSADQMETPEAYKRGDWTPPPHVQALMDERAENGDISKRFIGVAVSAEEALAAQALTCGMIAHIDDAVGEIMAHLEVLGMAENTVVAFTSDHGDYLGDHRLLFKGPAHYQSLINVPFIWSDPQDGREGEVTDTIASTMDIPAAILNRARVAPYVGFQGRDFIAALDAPEKARNHVLVEEEQQRLCYGFGKPPRVNTVVTDRYRLSVYQDEDWGELYDLRNDPGEFDNLWDVPEALPAKADLLERATRWHIRHADTYPFPTGQS